jgi:hypothetical protein
MKTIEKVLVSNASSIMKTPVQNEIWLIPKTLVSSNFRFQGSLNDRISQKYCGEKGKVGID